MHATANSPAFLRLLYGVYAWIILLFVVVPVTAGLLLVPGLERRRAIARWGAAAVLALIGSPVRVSGAAAHPVDHAVVVANHSSYLDGIILTAVLPPQFTFLIKHEMTSVPVAGFVLRRLGSEFVDRANASTRQRSARRLVEAARAGAALAVFPEGTFDLAPGLRAFHMGAFRAAWRVGLTVLPVVIRGARAKLPGEQRLPRPGPLTVEFCPPLNPADFGDETALMRAARAAMLARLGEPDLDPPPQSPE